MGTFQGPLGTFDVCSLGEGDGGSQGRLQKIWAEEGVGMGSNMRTWSQACGWRSSEAANLLTTLPGAAEGLWGPVLDQ